MSDKDFEKDNINGENGVSSNPTPADSESNKKADYEEESSWKFEASAPSLNADFLQSAGDAEIKVETPQYYAPEPAAPQENQVASKDIVIKKEKPTVFNKIKEFAKKHPVKATVGGVVGFKNFR